MKLVRLGKSANGADITVFAQRRPPITRLEGNDNLAVMEGMTFPMLCFNKSSE
jgi:hypothetical protein